MKMKLDQVLQGTGLKVIALVMAVALWTGVSSERREQTWERAFEVPVALVGVPRDVIVISPIQDTVSVRLKGPISTLRALSSQNLEVTIPMSDVRPGVMKMLIRPQALNLPPNTDVVSINPATLTFRVEARRNKSVPIRPFFAGQLPPGYSYEPSEVKVFPPTAVVSGPDSQVQEFDEVYTERIILSGRTGSFRQSVGLVSDVPLVQVTEPATATVEVSVAQPLPDATSIEDAIPGAGGEPPAPPVGTRGDP